MKMVLQYFFKEGARGTRDIY